MRIIYLHITGVYFTLLDSIINIFEFINRNGRFNFSGWYKLVVIKDRDLVDENINQQMKITSTITIYLKCEKVISVTKLFIFWNWTNSFCILNMILEKNCLIWNLMSQSFISFVGTYKLFYSVVVFWYIHFQLLLSTIYMLHFILILKLSYALMPVAVKVEH